MTNITHKLDLDNLTVLAIDRLKGSEDPDDVAAALGLDYDAEEEAVLLPGWRADDGNAEVDYPHAESGATAAQEYVEDGDYPSDRTQWHHVWAWRPGLAVAGGEVTEVTVGREEHTIVVQPTAPECSEDEHDWSQKSVQGNAGGVIVRDVCQHCGWTRVTDTWATDPTNGTQGHTAVSYEEPDEDDDWGDEDDDC